MRKEEEKEKKNAVVKSLITEVSDVKSILGRGLTGRYIVQDGHIEIKHLETLLTTDSFVCSVFSGYYQMLSIETQRNLSWFFRGCKRMNELGEQLEYSEFNKNEGIAMKFKLKNKFEALEVGLEKVNSILQSELDNPFEIILVRENSL